MLLTYALTTRLSLTRSIAGPEYFEEEHRAQAVLMIPTCSPSSYVPIMISMHELVLISLQG